MKKIVIFAVFILASSAAHAGFLIEPYVGMIGAGKFDFDSLAGADDGGKMTGNLYGARIGVKNYGFWVAANYTSFTGKQTWLTNGPADAASTTTSVDVGFDFPIKLRVYAGYGLNHKMTIKSAGALPDTTYNSTSVTKIGFGYSIAFFFSLNFEIIKPTYKTYEIGGVTSDVGTGFNSINNETTNVTLSFPFSL